MNDSEKEMVRELAGALRELNAKLYIFAKYEQTLANKWFGDDGFRNCPVAIDALNALTKYYDWSSK